MTITPLQAANLIARDYAGDLVTAERLDIDGVQTCIINVSSTDRVGLIRGSNELSDWFRYNLDFRPDKIPGDTYTWHSGFLAHARIAYAFLKGKDCTCIIGHSLGAAAGGIVAISLKIPAILFATPMTLFGDNIPPEASLIENYCRDDDLVTKVPFWFMNFKHCGKVNWMQPTEHIDHPHFFVNYLSLLKLLMQRE